MAKTIIFDDTELHTLQCGVESLLIDARGNRAIGIGSQHTVEVLEGIQKKLALASEN